jgi:hypothetical protein
MRYRYILERIAREMVLIWNPGSQDTAYRLSTWPDGCMEYGIIAR